MFAFQLAFDHKGAHRIGQVSAWKPFIQAVLGQNLRQEAWGSLAVRAVNAHCGELLQAIQDYALRSVGFDASDNASLVVLGLYCIRGKCAIGVGHAPPVLGAVVGFASAEIPDGVVWAGLGVWLFPW